jgi:hypothetical protein
MQTQQDLQKVQESLAKEKEEEDRLEKLDEVGQQE